MVLFGLVNDPRSFAKIKEKNIKKEKDERPEMPTS